MIHNVYFVGLLDYLLVRVPFTILVKGIMSNIRSLKGINLLCDFTFRIHEPCLTYKSFYPRYAVV